MPWVRQRRSELSGLKAARVDLMFALRAVGQQKLSDLKMSCLIIGVPGMEELLYDVRGISHLWTLPTRASAEQEQP